jgi:hypothetical protein
VKGNPIGRTDPKGLWIVNGVDMDYARDLEDRPGEVCYEWQCKTLVTCHTWQKLWPLPPACVNGKFKTDTYTYNGDFAPPYAPPLDALESDCKCLHSGYSTAFRERQEAMENAHSVNEQREADENAANTVANASANAQTPVVSTSPPATSWVVMPTVVAP